MEQRTIKEISTVKKTDDGVVIEIDSRVESDIAAVQKMVENCATGKCDCMTTEVKNKVSSMKFEPMINGNYGIKINGSVTVRDIHETIDRSVKNLEDDNLSSGCCST